MSTPVKARPFARAPKADASAPTRRSQVVIIGGSPRVSLLPPEVHARGRARRIRRRLAAAFVGILVLVVVAAGLATVATVGIQSSLTTAQNTATQLSGQQAKYSAVTEVQADMAGIKQAQITGTVQEVLWQPYVKELQGTLAGGMTITGIQASLNLPTNSTTTSVPLQGPHVATIKVSVSSPQASISDWLNKLPTLTGFVDAVPGSVTLISGSYQVEVTIHVNEAALSKRFAPTK
jgi:hypothetical protein